MEQTVELIASGYEWICLDCETLNREVEVYCEVVCEKCEKTFEVADHHHAFH